MIRWWCEATLLAALSACGTMHGVPAPASSAAPAAAPHASPIDAVEAERPHAWTMTWIKRLCDEDVPGSEGPLRALRTGRDVARLQTILVEEGVPPEMVAISAVESRLRRDARGRHGERGIWQIRPATARHLGLRVSAAREDRLDLERSTRAAARYLAALRARYGAWPLALAAYNAGEGRVDRALARHPGAAFWELAERRALPTHSRTYVPKVLAMSEVVAMPDACRNAQAASRPRDVLSPASARAATPGRARR